MSEFRAAVTARLAAALGAPAMSAAGCEIEVSLP
jgi:hypothetical protein